MPDDAALGASAFQRYSLKVPSALRAAGAVNSSSTEGVIVDGPNNSLGNQQNPVVQLGYNYNISGVELGLQHAPDLLLSVQGSCITDYSWYQYNDTTHEALSNGSFLNSIVADVYYPWNNSRPRTSVLNYNVGPPFVTFVTSPENNRKNQSFGMIISSLGRYSFRKGHDPWYLTTDTPANDTRDELLVQNATLYELVLS